MIASVNPCQEHASGFVRCTSPVAPRSTASTSAVGQVGGEGRGQALVGDHLQLALLARGPIIRVTKLPPLEALPCRP